MIIVFGRVVRCVIWVVIFGSVCVVIGLVISGEVVLLKLRVMMSWGVVVRVFSLVLGVLGI